MKIKTALRLFFAGLWILCPAIVWAKSVPEKTARRAAVHRMNQHNRIQALHQQRKGPARPQAARRIREADLAPAYTASKDGIAVYHVFNLAPEGWIIISADDAAYPVIAYSETGSYDPDVLHQPPAFAAWMDHAAAQIAAAAALDLQALPSAAAAWEQLIAASEDSAPDLDEPAAAEYISPLIQSTWGQGYQNPLFPGNDCCYISGCSYLTGEYNIYCPWEYTDWLHGCKDYCPTGCVATAMAQIMKYWQWPPFGFGNHGYDPPYSCSHECSGFGWREVDFAAQSYNWSNSSMPLNDPSDAIARLMRDIGIAVEMDYTPSSSGASSGDAFYAFHDYFRYRVGRVDWKDDYSMADWKIELLAELTAGRPIWYRGGNASGDSAHAFICDGYNGAQGFHFNWGWDGVADGFYTLDDLTPVAYLTEHNYTFDQAAIFGVEPIRTVYVDDNYSAGGGNDGHLWDWDAFSSIQRAIDAVYSGHSIHGTVRVAAGTYNESIDFKGKAIRVYAVYGPDHTILDGNHTALHVVQCVSGEGADSILEGFTITGGYAGGTSSPDDRGGGMYIANSSPTLVQCVFHENYARYGGALYISSGSPTITSCTFVANNAGEAGGIFNLQSSPTAAYCNFSYNTAEGIGGAMYNLNSSSPTVTACTFHFNTAGTCGGGMDNRVNSNPVVTNCVFQHNYAAGYGGAIYNYQNNPQIINCTFWLNISDTGGGLFNNYSSPTVTNCILYGNAYDEIINSNSTPNVTYCDVRGGYPGTGNIDLLPDYADPYTGDFHQQVGSPCLDAGNNAAVPAGIIRDLDEESRFADACRPDTGSGTPPIVDMGAYELQHTWIWLENLAVNPGFETGNADGWITNWGFTLTAVTNPVHEGSYSALTGNRTDSWQGAWQSIISWLEIGKTYHLSGWVRLQNAESDYVAMTVKLVDAAGTHYFSLDNATADNDHWTHLDGAFVMDANEPTELFVYFEGPAAGVNFYVDEVSIFEVPGDTDHSGDVDLFDFNLFASYYGLNCSAEDCGPANLEDCDNTVNLYDLALLVADWLVGVE